jgi:hypothetical protein
LDKELRGAGYKPLLSQREDTITGRIILINFLNKLDCWLLLRAARSYKNTRGHVRKPHSATLLLAVGIFYLSRLYAEPYFAFIVYIKYAIILYGILVVILSLYQWRWFLRLRGKGINHDSNLFFDESAGVTRKILFFAALFVYSIISSFDLDQVEEWKYLLRAEFYSKMSIYVLSNFAFSILLIESLRLIFPKMADWRNGKHAVSVVILATLLSLLQYWAFSNISGHGIF